MLKLYNTLSQKKEVFKPRKKRRVEMYTCGPTVYSFVHIGNLRSFILSDLLQKTLKYNGYSIKHVMNLTDVDDKTIKGTIKEFGKKAKKEDLKEYTKKYTKSFKEDLKKLNIKDPIFISATSSVENIKKAVKELLKNGFAYIKDGSTYFDIKKYNKKYKDYGELAGKKFLKGLKFGKAVSTDEYEKENIGDFVLWKKYDKERDGNIFWKDPVLGKGRPGWHIECSVISMENLSKQFDIHNGGIDLIFPHHTNEIAQSQALTDKKPFVSFWIHASHLIVNGEKMSKSKGNFYTLKDIEKEFNPLSFRYLCLTSHYQSVLNFKKESLKASQTALEKLREKTAEFKKEKTKKITNKTLKYKEKFLKILNENIDTAKALALTWKIVEDESLSKGEKYFLLLDFDQVLGLNLKSAKELKIPKEIIGLSEKREFFRKNKEWEKADEIRKRINKEGYSIEDTEKGPKIISKSK
jgi:cysteinyl-tRNA synthetase